MDAKSLQLWLVPPPVICPSIPAQHISVIPGFTFSDNIKEWPKGFEGGGKNADKKRKAENAIFNGFDNKHSKADDIMAGMSETQVKMEFQTDYPEQPTVLGMQTSDGNKSSGAELMSKKTDAEIAALMGSNAGVRTVCNTCGKWFRSRQQLTQHMLVHTDVRKYKCTYCGRAFKQPSHLQQHHRIHTGEKPYQCTMPGCARAFPQLSNLNHHLRNHDKPDPPSENTCTFCDRTYASETVLKNHLIKIHMIPSDCVGKCTTDSKNKKEKLLPDDQTKSGGDLSENMLQMFTSAILSPPTSGAPVPTPIFPMLSQPPNSKTSMPHSESVSTSKMCSNFTMRSLEPPFSGSMAAFGIDSMAPFTPTPKFSNSNSKARELQTLAMNYRRRTEQEMDRERDVYNGYINANGMTYQHDHAAKRAIYNKIPLTKIKESMTNSRWCDSPRKVSKEELSQHFSRYNLFNEGKIDLNSEQKVGDPLHENNHRFDDFNQTRASSKEGDTIESTNFEYPTQYSYTLDGVTDFSENSIKPEKQDVETASQESTQEPVVMVKTENGETEYLKDKHLAYEDLRREYYNAVSNSGRTNTDQIDESCTSDNHYSGAYRVQFVSNSDGTFHMNGQSGNISGRGVSSSEKKVGGVNDPQDGLNSEQSSIMKVDVPVTHNSRKRKSFNPQRVVSVDIADEAGVLIN